MEEEVYIHQPLSYKLQDMKIKFLKLKKTLYGLKQAPQVRNIRIDKYFQANDFSKCPREHAPYVKINKNEDTLLV